MAATSSRSTARSASSWPRAAAAPAGWPNTTCWPACRRARSAASPISSPASPRGGSSAACRWRCAAAATAPLSLYPAYGAFMSARGFQTSTGIQHFYDARDLGAKGIEPDSFFYDKAVEADRRAAGQYAAVHLRLSRRQPFSLGNQIPPRPAAVLAQARQRAGGRRISAPPGDERRRLCAASSPA